MKKLPITALLFLLITSTGANAAVSCNGTTQCEGPARELISRFFSAEDSGARKTIIASPDIVNNLPCTTSHGGPANVILPESAVFEENYAVLLTSYLNNNEILIRIADNPTECTVLHLRLIG